MDYSSPALSDRSGFEYPSSRHSRNISWQETGSVSRKPIGGGSQAAVHNSSPISRQNNYRMSSYSPSSSQNYNNYSPYSRSAAMALEEQNDDSYRPAVPPRQHHTGTSGPRSMPLPPLPTSPSKPQHKLPKVAAQDYALEDPFFQQPAPVQQQVRREDLYNRQLPPQPHQEQQYLNTPEMEQQQQQQQHQQQQQQYGQVNKNDHDRLSSWGQASSIGTTSSTDRESAGTSNTATTEPPAYSKKIVVVGDGGCGKTCLLISYSQGYFPQKYVPTVFENYITTAPHRPSGKNVELALWDTAGQEEYDRLRPLSYPETDLLLVCFSIDCPNSLENVMDKWYPEVLHFCPTTPVVLVGLKSDLRMNPTCIEMLRAQGLKPVSREQGLEVARHMEAAYMECSSKTMTGVNEIFDHSITIAVGDEHLRSQPGYKAGNPASNQVFGADNMPGNMPGKRKKRNRMCKIF